MRALHDYNVAAAAYDSSQRDAHGCLDDTRTDILEKIVNWVDEDNSCPIFWLSGYAGAGKSTIAHDIAKTSANISGGQRKLAASFFFSRGMPHCDTTARFVLSIAYQLAIMAATLKPSMRTAIDNNPAIPNKNVEEQFRLLILEPIRNLEPPLSTMVVVVDALDECEDRDAVKKLIRIIASACREPLFPLRFFFTSRRDNYIAVEFADHALTHHEDLELWKAHDDIRTLLRARFQEICRTEHQLVPTSWPSTEQIEKLVESADGLFIWAETLVKFIRGGIDSGSGLPDDLLQIALDTPPGLDALYQQVFAAAHLNSHSAHIIGVVMCLRDPLPIEQLGLLLTLGTRDIRLALRGLESILNIPFDDDEEIQPFHASLHDFLTSSGNSEQFFISHHTSILLHCFGIILDNQEGRVDKEVALYACANWCYHFQRVLTHGGEDDLLHSRDGALVMKYLRDLVAGRQFRWWFETVLADNWLLQPRRDLGSVTSMLTVSNVLF
jgi:hypothetical protein